jgi:hypothetical protein
MIEVDLQLISDARSFCSGANVHHVKTLIFCYEESVLQAKRCDSYDNEFENELRQFVRKHQSDSWKRTQGLVIPVNPSSDVGRRRLTSGVARD